MAKENSYPSALLFIAASILLTGGWLMSSFPIFIFFAFAPLFALTDRVDQNAVVWEKMEWILLALTVSFLAARVFDFSVIVSSMLYAILFILPFMGYTWSRHVLGNRVGKITIVLLWLTIEYLLLKVHAEDSVFLADALRIQTGWIRWNIYTGYLGVTFWILLTNLSVYQALLSKNPFQWYWIILAVIMLCGPAISSYFIDASPITRSDMVNLYSKKLIVKDVTYLAQGEFVVRTAAWLSTLILIFTFIKSQTTKR